MEKSDKCLFSNGHISESERAWLVGSSRLLPPGNLSSPGMPAGAAGGDGGAGHPYINQTSGVIESDSSHLVTVQGNRAVVSDRERGRPARSELI